MEETLNPQVGQDAANQVPETPVDGVTPETSAEGVPTAPSAEPQA